MVHTALEAGKVTASAQEKPILAVKPEGRDDRGCFTADDNRSLRAEITPGEVDYLRGGRPTRIISFDCFTYNGRGSCLRKKVLLRDGRRCPLYGGRQVSGCGRSHFVEVHHLLPQGVCGDHVPEHLLVVCQFCHNLVHEGRLVIEGKAPGR